MTGRSRSKFVELYEGLTALSELSPWQHRADEVRRVFEELNVEVSDDQVGQVLDLLRGRHWGIPFQPPSFYSTLSSLIEGRSFNTALDPWASNGAVLCSLLDRGCVSKGVGVTNSTSGLAIAQILGANLAVEWIQAQPLTWLSRADAQFDLIVSAPPWNVGPITKIKVKTATGQMIVRDSKESLVLLESCRFLKQNGLGVFFLPPYFSQTRRDNGVYRRVGAAGLSIDAILQVPRGTWGTGTHLDGYWILVSRRKQEKVFVGQISSEKKRATQTISNLRKMRPGKDPGLGVLVDKAKFRSFPAIETQDRVQKIAARQGLQEVSLLDLVTEVNLAKRGAAPRFPDRPNSIFVPLLGWRDAVGSINDLVLKPHNYVQLVVDPDAVLPDYLTYFFSSPLGHHVRELAQSGITIPKISKSSLSKVRVYLPPLDTQSKVLEAKSKVSSLLAEVRQLGERLSQGPRDLDLVVSELKRMSRPEGFREWLETLPYPLASILWAYETAGDNHRERYEHLLHFFHALSEFFAIVFLSAAQQDQDFFKRETKKLRQNLGDNNLSFERATFGTWRCTVEQFSKIFRRLTHGEKDTDRLKARSLLKTRDETVLTMLTSSRLVSLLQKANLLRNSWEGHTGIVGKDEAKRRHAELRRQLDITKEALGYAWDGYSLVMPGVSRFAGGTFNYTISRLHGCSTPFVKDKIALTHPLDEDLLYLLSEDETSALPLLPLLQVTSAPGHAKNACYFYDRKQGQEVRFVSYHFEQEAEFTREVPQTVEVINALLDS